MIHPSVRLACVPVVFLGPAVLAAGLQDLSVIDYAIHGTRPGWTGGADALSWSNTQNAGFTGTMSSGLESGDGIEDSSGGDVWSIDTGWGRYALGTGFEFDVISGYASARDPYTPLAAGDTFSGTWTLDIRERVDLWMTLQEYAGAGDPTVTTATMTSSTGTVIDLGSVIDPSSYDALVSLDAGIWTLDFAATSTEGSEFIGFIAWFADPSIFGSSPAVPSGPVPLAMVAGLFGVRGRRR